MVDTARTDGGGVRDRVREWVLLDGNRLVVAGGLLALVFAAVSALDVAASLAAWSSPSMVGLFGAYVTGNLTLVTVVLSINQLVLSRELRTPRAMQEEISGAVAFQNDVERLTAARADPSDLPAFLRLLLESMHDCVERVAAAAEATADDDARAELREFARAVGDAVAELDEPLQERDADLFTGLSTILDRDFATEFGEARRLGDEHADALGADGRSALADFRRHVRQLETARQYVKTIYVQQELAQLSRLLLYVGFVTVAAAAAALALDAGTVPTSTPALALGVTLGFAPLALLFAFVLRIATVAQRSAAFVPFGTPAS